MRVKYWMALTFALFYGNVRGEYAVEWFEKYQEWSIESVTVTSDGLSIRFKNPWFFIFLDWDKADNEFRSSADYIRNNEPLILTPDNKEVCLGQQHTRIHFTPVSYRNGLKGFRITDIFYGAPYGLRTNNVLYVTLSDTPIEVGENDVETIKDKGEWKTYENPQSITQAETPDKITEDEPSEEKNKTNIFWLCVVIFHCLLAILWLARKKRKHGTNSLPKSHPNKEREK